MKVFATICLVIGLSSSGVFGASAAKNASQPISIAAASMNNPADVQIKCSEWSSSGYCYLNFYGNKTYSRFTPINTKNDTNVTYVTLGGRVPVLGDEICNTFPKLLTLGITYANVEEILPNAFEKCRNMKTLNMYGNNIRVLPKETFRYNSQLEYLSLYSCKLKELHPSLFTGLYNLKSLYLYDNYLTEFPAELVKTNSELTTLNLNKNDLLDIDEVKLLEYLPNLSTIYLNGNQLSCDRLQEIRSYLQPSAYLSDYIYSSYRKRSYLQDTFENFLCLPGDTWLSVYNQEKARNKKDSSYQISVSG